MSIIKYKCIRSYAGEYRAGMGDILDEIPPGVSPLFFEVVEMESAMMPPAKPKTTGEGNLPVSVIRGVGPRMALQLGKLGIEKVADLAAADPEQIASIKGATPRLIEAARRMLS